MPTQPHLSGKGIYIWQIGRALPYDTLLENIARANLSHVIFKVADGWSNYNTPYLSVLIPILRAKFPNLRIYGYQYVYSGCWLGQHGTGYQYLSTWSPPEKEAQTLANLYRNLGLDGVVIDVEGEFEHFGQEARATIYCSNLRKLLPDALVILSSFRYPGLNYHPDVPWSTFCSIANVSMPQVYWMGDNSDNAGVADLDASYKQYQTLYTSLNLPLEYVPTGAAFHEGGWGATPLQVQNFLNRLSTHNITSVNLWEYWYAAVEKPEFWQAYSDFNFSVPTPIPTPNPIQSKILTINVGAGNRANLRSQPWGAVLVSLPNATTLHASASKVASDGSLWWFVGSGYVAASTVLATDSTQV